MSIERVLRQLGIAPKKSLGQHFIVDASLAAKIAELVPRGARVVEVGGGLGTLTAFLIGKTSKLIVIEVDRKLASYLKEKYGQAQLIQADFLKTAIPETDYVVSSVPYSISKKFVLKLVGEGDSWREALLILQKEFVEKLLAKPCEENYRAISVVVQAACHIQPLEFVAPECFYPPPKVDSVLVRLSVRDTYVREKVLRVEKLAFRLFGFKNRTVRAALKGAGLPIPAGLSGDPILESRVGCLGVDGVLRLAETL